MVALCMDKERLQGEKGLGRKMKNLVGHIQPEAEVKYPRQNIKEALEDVGLGGRNMF